jgi:CubicO group peptidase (beta-lactamase class C family)
MPELVPLPAQPLGVSWPTDDWPVAEPPTRIAAQLERLLDTTFAEPQPETTVQTNALLVVHRGRIVAERYATGISQSDTLHSWSMAKSMLAILYGLLVRDGKLRISDRAPIAAWQLPNDPRAAITIDSLLHMTSGLHFVEDYVDDQVSDTIKMLFRPGADDTGDFAASLPLDHAPDTFFNYSSGTTNILSSIARDALGGQDGYAEYLRRELFAPIGMSSAQPKFDASGSWIASTFCYCTARDFARFALFCLRDGAWNGSRILPEGWIDYCRTQGPVQPGADNYNYGYGAQWWLSEDRFGAIFAPGYSGQRLMLVPALDVIVVRLGNTPVARRTHLIHLLSQIIDLFARA